MAESNRFPKLETKVEVSNVGSGAKAPESSSVKTVIKSESGIEVIALREGFFQNARKNEGDKFIVPSVDKLGSWMKCTDSGAEKLHQEALAKKKAALK